MLDVGQQTVRKSEGKLGEAEEKEGKKRVEKEKYSCRKRKAKQSGEEKKKRQYKMNEKVRIAK